MSHLQHCGCCYLFIFPIQVCFLHVVETYFHKTFPPVTLKVYLCP